MNCRLPLLKEQIRVRTLGLIFSTSGCSGGITEAISAAPRACRTEALPQSGGQVMLQWANLPGASEYKVQFKQVGRREIVTKYVSSAEVMLGGLQTGARYLFRVRALSGAARSYSEVNSLTALWPRQAIAEQLRLVYAPYIIPIQSSLGEAGYRERQSAIISYMSLMEAPSFRTLARKSPSQNSPSGLILISCFQGDITGVEDEDGFTYREAVDLANSE